MADVSKKGDAFTAGKLAWLDAVANDPKVTDGAFRIAYVLSGFFNRKSGDAWPSQLTLAAKVRMSRRGLQKALAVLIESGHLEVKIGRGRGGCNSYRPATEKANPSSHQTAEIGEPQFAFTEQKGEPECAPKLEKGEPQFAGGANGSSQGGRTPVRTEPFESKPLIETIEVESLSAIPSNSEKADAKDVSAFEAFWNRYPRRVAKGAARRAFQKALQSTRAETILEGARRYAAERLHEDRKFTKHPATWLNGECWADENKPPDVTLIPGPDGSRRISAVEQVLRNHGRIP